MSMNNDKDSKPTKSLKEKAGDGGIPKHLLDDAQYHIRDNDIDFRPMATKHLKIIDDNFQIMKSSTDDSKKQENFKVIVENIMQIKAHGGMFNYDVMSQIAAITLHILENAKEINEDLFQLIEVHNNSIKLVIARNIKGNGGEQGQAIVNELEKATLRYSKKYSS